MLWGFCLTRIRRLTGNELGTSRIQFAPIALIRRFDSLLGRLRNCDTVRLT